MNRLFKGFWVSVAPTVPSPDPTPSNPVDIAECLFAKGHWQRHCKTVGCVKFLCWGCGIIPHPEKGQGWKEAEVLLSRGAVACFFRDHPADCWPSASEAPGNSISVPGVS